MRLTTLLYALCASRSLAASTSELIDSAIISLQPVSASPSTIQALAEIKYNPSTLSAEIVSFEQPDLPSPSSSSSDSSSSSSSTSSDPGLVRIGIHDPNTGTWKSSTSTTSTESFAKGYACTIVLTLDGQGEIVGATVKGSQIDAGQTRDFGPRVVVRRVGRGGTPELNKPVVLREGKLEEPEVEKTMLQKYWWVLLGGLMLLLTTGGAE